MSMSSNKSLLKKLVSLVCAASSVGLSASAAETDVEESKVVGTVESNDVDNVDEKEQDDGFRSMSSLFDFTYSESDWREKITKDRDSRVGDALALDGLGDRAGEVGPRFKNLVNSLADSCYEVRPSFAWSKGYVNDDRLDSLLNGSSELWGAISSVCSEVDVITSSGVSYRQVRASFRNLSKNLSNVTRVLGDMEVGGDVFLDFVKSSLTGYLKTCDAVLAKRRIKSSLESDFSKQLGSVVVRSGAGEAVDAVE